MDYQAYSAKDFTLDEFFQQWVKHQNPEAKNFWEVWLLQHPEKADEIEEARRMLQSMSFTAEELTEEQQQQILNRILARIEPHRAIETSVKTIQLSNRVRWYRIAAVVLALLVAGIVLWWYRFGPESQMKYVTRFGETRTVILPDQSEVVMNANSTLKYPTHWADQESREVWLNGEAFFKVEKKVLAGEPVKFTVHSGDLKLEVLGTQFTVSKRQLRTLVVLNEGRIRLELPGQTGPQEIVMKPGELVEYQAGSHMLVRRKVNAEVYSSWTSNRWILEDITLQQVASRIEETYGIKVRIPDARLGREPMTGVLPTESLDKLLSVLSATYGLRVSQKENLITLTK